MEYLILGFCILLAILILIYRIKRFIKILYREDQDDYYHTYVSNDEVWTVKLKKSPEESISFKEKRDV